MAEEKPIKETDELVIDGIDHDVMEMVDSYHPLFLHANDNPGLSMISIVLTSSENYAMRSRAMHFTIIGRNKLGFVSGTCVREKFDPTFHICGIYVMLWFSFGL